MRQPVSVHISSAPIPYCRRPTVVLRVRLDHVMDADPEVLHPAQLLHLFRRKREFGEIPDILANRPDGPVRFDAGLVPPHQLLGCGKVLGDGLLRQDMFSCLEG